MNKAILCIGVDLFDKDNIGPLTGAAQDARRWASFFEHRLGFTALVLTHEELRAGARVLDAIDQLLAVAGQDGDMLGVFIATHGKQVPHPQGGHDQAFFLPHARLASIEAGSLGEGALSLRQLALETARPGLQRFFMIDACRAPLRQAPAGALRDAAPAFEAEGQIVYRDPLLCRARDPAVHSPLLVVNACADRQRAGELRQHRRGIFSMAAEEVAAKRLNQGLALSLDHEFLATVGARMRQLAGAYQDDGLVQDPVIDQGDGLCLWSPPVATLKAQGDVPRQAVAAQRLPGLLDRFEQQLQAGRLASPPWDCCIGTLALLHEAGLGQHTLDLLQRQVEQAVAATAPPAAPAPPVAPAPAKSASRPNARPDWSRMPAGHVFQDAEWSPRMVLVPAGRFVMGSPEDEIGRQSFEGPQHVVHIRQPFAMGRTVVTFDDYDLYAQDAGAQLPKGQGWGRGGRPVINVSWHDAQAYIVWLNRQLGLSALRGYRLPSEAEWEYAARAGSTTPFWWGKTISAQQANFNARHVTSGLSTPGEYRRKTVPADAFTANPWGLFNVHGNVWEWVQDSWHEDYRGAPGNEQAWQDGSDKSRRVVRGGSWSNNPVDLRSADRRRLAPAFRISSTGFRLARTF